jgi:hypothetical protein
VSSSTIFALSLRKVTHSMTEAITTFPNPSNPITSHSDITRCYYPLDGVSRTATSAGTRRWAERGGGRLPPSPHELACPGAPQLLTVAWIVSVPIASPLVNALLANLFMN